MSKAQIETYRNPTNNKRRVILKDKILNLLKLSDKVYNNHSLSLEMCLKYSQIQPRISELITSGHIIEVGKTIVNGQPATQFRLSPNPGLFSEPRKTKYQMLKEAIKRIVDPEIAEIVNEEYIRLIRKNKFNPLEKLDRNLEMLRMWEGGHKYSAIAKKYGISETRVSRIVKSYRIKKSRNEL